MEGFLDTTAQYTGRKAKVGKTVMINEQGKQIIGRFVAYCPTCNYKVCLSQSQMVELLKLSRRADKSLRERCIRYLLAKLEYKGSYTPDLQRERKIEAVMSKY